MPDLSSAEMLQAALAAARQGAAEGGIPIGAALFVGGELIATGYNRRVQNGSMIHHGETNCFENAGREHMKDFHRAVLVTTLSPCDMCTGASLLYRIPRIIIGENRTFVGGEELLKSRGVEVEVLDDAECYALMHDFAAREPELWNEDIGDPE